ncbi:thiamine-phosphate kinase [Microbacterium sp. zg.Y1090]|uniref:thiamine-phosphate kinase n=1 Tax=Microbacterium wangruii TaxID=3049073 RepID=UPI00214D417B|nr:MULTISPECIES: thiamine-phosphate kinase [unclassified Microbacterium]MCR2818963.1 thiamine-phosphate kinase [Microbacterium sp. zg.Y1090]WIM27268.1 thiamine-phosphate kinase [Microbacterium sp. zg-Y1090]
MSSAPGGTVGDVGESVVLQALLKVLAGSSAAVIGPGDDAAVLAVPGGRAVVTTDTLVQGPDFRLAWSGGVDLGFKAAAVNLADVAAMGARPTALFVALAMPADTTVDFVTDLAAGLREACDALAPGCAVEGGDLTISDTLTIAVTAVGVLDGVEPVRRGGARPGDVVALAGHAGLAAAGLALLFSRFRGDAGAALPVDRSALTAGELLALDAQLRPHPPIALGPQAAAAGATAMMDVSDGLALDARRLAAASGVTLVLSSAALGPDPVAALEGGEDHALLATFPPGAPLPDGFRVIGGVVQAGAAAVQLDGAPYDAPGGWDPYRDWDRQAG